MIDRAEERRAEGEAGDVRLEVGADGREANEMERAVVRGKGSGMVIVREREREGERERETVAGWPLAARPVGGGGRDEQARRVGY